MGTARPTIPTLEMVVRTQADLIDLLLSSPSMTGLFGMLSWQGQAALDSWRQWSEAGRPIQGGDDVKGDGDGS